MDLLTAADIEQGMGLGAGTLNAAKLSLITTVSAKLAVHCGRDDWGPKQERTEYHDGGQSSVRLKYWPVDTGASISVYDDLLHEWAASSIVDPDLYHVDAANGVISCEGFALGLTGVPCSDIQNHHVVKVTYTGGYDYADIPQDLKNAALLQYEREYDVRYRSGSRQGERPGFVEVLPEVVEIIRKYTRRDMFA